MRIITAMLFMVLAASTFAANTIEVPVEFVVPDRELTAKEKSFLATVPVEAGGRLREAVEQMLKASVCHVTASGRYEGNSVHYWTLYQAWTGPHKVILTLPEQPAPPIPPPPPLPPPPCPPPVVNVYPQVECPEPPVCPAPVVNNYISCPTPAPRQPHAGAQVVRYNYGGADVMVGWGFGRGAAASKRLCKPPYPNPPIVPPPVPPAPPMP